MKLSVIILNYNVRYFLEQCIISVQKATRAIDAEIIIVDNNSSDDSCVMVKDRFPELTCIENKENVGFSKANNQAVAIARGDYVCILNPDTAVAEDVFIKALQYAESLEDLGALGCYLMDGTGSFLPESKRNLPRPMVSALKLAGFTKKYYANHISENNAGSVAVLVGAFMLLKRSVYLEVGGFDEDYFMYGEDIDLSYKLEKAGYKNYYLGAAKTLHYKGESTTKNKVYLERFYGAMNIFYGKHFTSNFLLDTLVKLAVKFKMSRVSDSEALAQKEGTLEAGYVLTENFDLFSKISTVIDTPVKAASKSIFQDSLFKNTVFVFDAAYMSYDQIFTVMTQLRGRGNQFRIRPPYCSFILGSDQSDQKGSVLVF
ncbi:MAG: GT2 family glycosyltransferase [Patiriisocius sp.]